MTLINNNNNTIEDSSASDGNGCWSSEQSCDKVRHSCYEWMKDSNHSSLVMIHDHAIKTLASDILSRQQRQQQQQRQQSSSSSTSQASPPTMIEWDEEQWHYQPSTTLPKNIAMARLALYILAMDAINFCFWPSHHDPKKTKQTDNDNNEINFEYEHLAMAMSRMAQQDEGYQECNTSMLSPHYIFAPSKLATITKNEMKELLNNNLKKIACTNTTTPTTAITPLDNIEKRCQLWNEIGKVLLEQPWNGSILKFLYNTQEGQGKRNLLLSAPKLVDRIVQYFPGFRDGYSWQKQQQQQQQQQHDHDNRNNNNAYDNYLYLYKRAQICVGDWNASLKLNLTDMDHVTTFADYRVPQLLREMDVLEYASVLANKIDNYQEIIAGSVEEKTIRAATVVAVEQLVHELQQQQQQLQERTTTRSHKDDNSEFDKDKAKKSVFTAVTVDWYLWQVGERMHNEGSLKPHHRTRTTFY